MGGHFNIRLHVFVSLWFENVSDFFFPAVIPDFDRLGQERYLCSRSSRSLRVVAKG